MSDEFDRKLELILEEDDRYHKDAYLFIFEAIEYTMSSLKERRHVSGQELLKGIRGYAAEMYGPTARLVFDHWGVKDTIDFGNIVFNLVRFSLLAKTEGDTIDDFKAGFDFKKVFEDDYAWTTEKADG